MTSQRERPIEGVKVIIELYPGTFGTPEVYFNLNANLFDGFMSQSDFDVKTLSEKLPLLIKALDLNGDIEIFVEQV